MLAYSHVQQMLAGFFVIALDLLTRSMGCRDRLA
jgi:hypothetical protein